MTQSGPILHTDRLILRPVRADDFEAWAAGVADATAMRFLGGPQVRSVAWRSFTSVVGAWSIQGFGMFSVIERASGRWLGRVGPHRPEGWPGTEVGWMIVREAWRQGYATEAAVATMEFAVEELGWTEVIHCIDESNTASQRVAQRLGSKLIGQANLPPPIEQEIDVWGQTAADWRASRPKV